ncbi:hypothetical protein LTR99_002693 [Exophiala xenobiotica]|uniref:Fumarylacetoacetase-like C-terminal domain-containing protein n=1 Tax=Vermiconidia calcicola TaxID=1690605 RepID=A0AAV9QE98_9PEZI|nr:hypothetical protein LTR99_002693 [Exophiala xenobiotica]KAK5433739.1 hypothetical protein LTR34_003251 [Exophiala xenobiotica]KAK5541971.1 hypothetical protein LTR25_001856 [Vermiconidia calcicola]KAK5543086.1 hypothetical protein LTR23_005127 [Chaetothyriales sp. CCFEE 6169]
MTQATPFDRLVRFENEAGIVLYGEVTADTPTINDLIGSKVDIYEGNGPWSADFKRTSNQDTIAKVLSPIPHAPIFHGIGLNYRRHAEEAGHPIPAYPVVFQKPSPALAGPYEDIPIDKEAKFLDYECELSVIIGKDCKNLSDSDDPFDYVLGYTVGNDVSARFWQAPAQSGGQHAYAKSFDKFAPSGPVLVSTSVIHDPAKLTLKTWVNGEERQSSGIDDLIFDVPALIRFLSKGRTLEKGTVIMTGTPSGVAAFMKPPAWLADGDVVEMEIAGIGRIKNNMVFMQ